MLFYWCNDCGPSTEPKCLGSTVKIKRWALCPWVDHYWRGGRTFYAYDVISTKTVVHTKCYEDFPSRGIGVWKDFTEEVTLYPGFGLAKGGRKRENHTLQELCGTRGMQAWNAHDIWVERVCFEVVQPCEDGEGRQEKRLEGGTAGMQDDLHGSCSDTLCLLDTLAWETTIQTQCQSARQG